MFNTVQFFGGVLLGGLFAGELSRRLLALPRTTGYVVFGLLAGQSGFAWISSAHIESAHLFIDLALGLILFELGYLVPIIRRSEALPRLRSALGVSLASGLLIGSLVYGLGFPIRDCLFVAALCLATSPAITIATSSDVGAKGEKTGLLYTMVAINGCVAFSAVSLLMPFMAGSLAPDLVSGLLAGVGQILESVVLGVVCALLIRLGAAKLGKQAEHQHLLILGVIVLGVGTAIQLELSVLLPMLLAGVLIRLIDRDRKVMAIRIASDARVFLVITFVLAGAALDIRFLQEHWLAALAIVLIRFVGSALVTLLTRRQLGLSLADGMFLAIGLQPMSSVALVLLANSQILNSGINAELNGIVLAAILLMQLLGPLATQTAIKGFGEATLLKQSAA